MDLNLLPLVRQYGKDQLDVQGLHIAAKPRRPARGRNLDRLILFLAMEGNAPLPPNQQDQVLAGIAQTYYKTPGSVTAALRAAAEALNNYLLERNLSNANTGQQGIGLLVLIAIRENRLYLGQCGPTQTYVLTSNEVNQFSDPQPTRRGLGLGRTTPIHYSQTELHENDLLLVMLQSPAAWNESAFSGFYGQALESLHPRLLKLTDEDCNALLIQARSGPGKIFLLRPKPAAIIPESSPAVSDQLIQEDTATPDGETPSIAAPLPVAAPVTEIELIPPLEAPETQDVISPPPQRTTPPPAQPAETASTVPPMETPRTRATGRSIFATLVLTFSRTFNDFSESMRTLFKRMLPEESLASLPGPLMAFIAVAIPIVVVAISMVVYFQRGRASQYDDYYAQAVQAASAAQAETDPKARMAAWQTSLDYLDQAEAFQMTEESQDLRNQAYQAIDQSELIWRIDYQPALTEDLPEGVRIRKLAVTGSDIYILDGNTGNVLRAFSTARGYELDTEFQCGPEFIGSQGIGPLVDIKALPIGEAPVMGMDSQGNILYCVPGDPPLFEALALPFTQWGQPTAFTIADNNLYVLDPQKNAVWIYWNRETSVQPDPFFTENFPPMQSVIDLTVDKSDLYLLHVDGHATLCTYSELDISPTHCTDPMPYIDTRPGQEGSQLSPQPAFSQIASKQPPDPSIFLLDPPNQSLYHFSQRLIYQRQLRPLNTLSPSVDGPAPAVAFAFSPDQRVAFLATETQIFHAGMP